MNDSTPVTRADDVTAPLGWSAAPAESFGDYEILGEIARGGMGVVYKARQVSLNRVVALKMMLAGPLAGVDARRRFRAEAEAAAALEHPNIVPIYEVGESLGRPFFTMKYIDGGTMSALVGRPREAAAALAKVARAVHHAHQRGVLHRDLKPGNVLMDGGEPRVADFGLAKRTDDASQTQSGAVLGTPAYMAPEQAQGIKGLTTAADVWALGAILYECVTGRQPFQGVSTVFVLNAVIHHEPARADGDLGVIAHKCLSKEPGHRYETALALAEDVERWLRGEPILAKPAGPLGRAWRWARRNPALAALSAGMVLATVASLALAAWALGEKRRADANAAESREQKAKTEDALVQVTKQREKAEWLVYTGRLSLAQAALGENNAHVAAQHLQACQPELRGWEYRHLASAAAEQPGPRLEHRGGVDCVAWSADGQRLASGGSDGKVRVWDWAKGVEVAALEGHPRGVWALDWSRDGKRLASGGAGGGAVRVWDAAGRLSETFEAHARGVYALAWSADGQRLASGGTDGGVALWEAGKVSRPGAPSKVQSVAWAADGRLAGGGDGLVYVWDKGRRTGLAGHVGTVWSVAWSPDGERLASGGSDGTVRVWDAAGESVTLRGHTARVLGVAWSPDGQRLASAGGDGDGTVRIWDVRRGAEAAALKGHKGRVMSVAWSPDGKRLASGGRDGGVRVWDSDAADLGPSALAPVP